MTTDNPVVLGDEPCSTREVDPAELLIPGYHLAAVEGGQPGGPADEFQEDEHGPVLEVWLPDGTHLVRNEDAVREHAAELRRGADPRPFYSRAADSPADPPHVPLPTFGYREWTMDAAVGFRLDVVDLQNHLRAIGWPIANDGSYGPMTRQAVTDFQFGWAFEGLLIDGVAGPATLNALSLCVQRSAHCSGYFRFPECRSHGNGWIRVNRHHAFQMDRYRERIGPINVVSWYRDPAHNAAVGGATNSRHLYGDATNHRGRQLSEVRGYRLFTGLGYSRSSGVVLHADSRPGDPARPTIWAYA